VLLKGLQPLDRHICGYPSMIKDSGIVNYRHRLFIFQMTAVVDVPINFGKFYRLFFVERLKRV
jgi:hypothetical protein